MPDGHLSRLNGIEGRHDVLGRGMAAREWDLCTVLIRGGRAVNPASRCLRYLCDDDGGQCPVPSCSLRSSVVTLNRGRDRVTAAAKRIDEPGVLIYDLDQFFQAVAGADLPASMKHGSGVGVGLRRNQQWLGGRGGNT